MGFRISFKTCNEAFDKDGVEVGRILRGIALEVEARRTEGKVRDINGNTVGSWSLNYGCACRVPRKRG